MIITDDHMHLYNHLKLKALEQFRNAGGTHVFLVNLLSKHYGITPTKAENFLEIYERHIRMVEKANKIVRAFAVIGVHPAEISILGERMGFEKAADLMKSALDLAGKLIEDGRAVALKSGRPHYKVSKEVWKLSNEVMMHAFEVAKDVGCAIQLHTESYTYEGMKEIAEIADEAGLKREKVVKHFSPPKIKEFEEIGIFPSVICLDDYVLAAAKEGCRFTLETDYIDDKSRPGAVLGPRTVPRKIKELLKHGFNEDFVYKICVENVEKVYGVNIE
uniref:Metal-dependent hydrolase n=1 Tax=Geoglobus ahangari TaxID=113653 RepID=A0A7J3TIW6_9EURY